MKRWSLLIGGLIGFSLLHSVDRLEFFAICDLHFRADSRIPYGAQTSSKKINALYQVWHSMDCCDERHQGRFINVYVRLYGLYAWLNQDARSYLAQSAYSLYGKLKNVYNSYWYIDGRWMQIDLIQDMSLIL